MSNMYSKIKAMLNSNGRTNEEAELFRDKAEKMMDREGIRHLFTEELKAKPEQPKAKAKKASKPKKAKTVKDDGRMRQIKAVYGINAKTGKKMWANHSVCTHANLARLLALYRADGMEVKSSIIK